MALGSRSSRAKSSAPEVQYAEHVKRLEDRIRALENAATAIPLLEADPDLNTGYNMWVFPDGRLRVRVPQDYTTTPTTYLIVEFAAVAVPGPSANTIGSMPSYPTAPTTRLSRYTATWAQTYKEDGVKRTDIPGVLGYGWQDNVTKRNRSLLGFDTAAIAADLTGSTVIGVKLEIQMLNAPHDTTTAFLGIHNYSSAPVTWAGGSIPVSMALNPTFTPNVVNEAALTLAFATMIREGTGKGIAFEAPSDATAFAGLASGFGSGYENAVLVVEYVK